MVKRVCAAAMIALLAGAAAPRAFAAADADTATPPFPASTDQGAAMIWLRDNTNLGVGRYVAFAPDNVVVVLSDEPSTRAPGVHRISFRQEATRLDFVSRTGGRSLRGSGEIDCNTGSFRAEKVELFSGTNLRGDRIASEGPDSVGRVPRTGSAPAQAATQVCSADPGAPAPLATTARRPTTVAPATSRPAATPSTSAPAPSVIANNGDPAPLPPPPRRVAVQEGSTLPAVQQRGSEIASAPPPAPRAPPVAASRPVATRPVPAPPPAGETVAQIGAFSSREAAERAWSRLADLFPDVMAGKAMRIDTVSVNGAPVYRSAIGGFTDSADALALCSRLMSSSEACFIRKAP